MKTSPVETPRRARAQASIEVVEPGEGHQQPDRDHPARDRVAEPRAEHQRPRRAARAHPGAEADDHRPGHRRHRREAGERQRVGDETHGSAGRGGSGRCPPPSSPRIASGSRKPTKSGRTQSVRRRPGAPAGEALRLDRRETPAAAVGPRLPALDALGPGEEQREGEQAEGELRRGGAVLHREPRLVDAGREGPHVEEGDGAVVGDRLHDRQQHPRRDRRPRHRQAHPQEGAPRPLPQRPRREVGRGRLLGEGGPRQQVDVRIEDAGQHHRRAGQRAHVREPVVARPPAGHRPQRRLHRARDGRGSRCRRRRAHRPGRRAAARAATSSSREPGKRYMVTSHAAPVPIAPVPIADEGDEHQRVEHVAGQHRREQPAPGLEVARERRERRGDDRRDADRADDPRQPVEQPLSHPALSRAAAPVPARRG